MPGVGHGVAEQPLHRRPGHPQRHSHRRPHDDPRQPDLLDHELFGPSEVRRVEPERGDHDPGDVADGDVDGAEAQGDQAHHDHERQQDRPANRQPGADAKLPIAAQGREPNGLQNKTSSVSAAGGYRLRLSGIDARGRGHLSMRRDVTSRPGRSPGLRVGCSAVPFPSVSRQWVPAPVSRLQWRYRGGFSPPSLFSLGRAPERKEPSRAYGCAARASRMPVTSCRKGWYRGRDSNPHAFRPRILSPLRLPSSATPAPVDDDRRSPATSRVRMRPGRPPTARPPPAPRPATPAGRDVPERSMPSARNAVPCRAGRAVCIARTPLPDRRH